MWAWMVSSRAGDRSCTRCTVRAQGRKGDCEDLLNGARDARDKAAELVEQGRQKAAELVEEGKRQAKETIDKGREYYDKGRTQWAQYVEKGKNLINEQQAKVEAAVEAGKEAYINTTIEPQA